MVGRGRLWARYMGLGLAAIIVLLTIGVTFHRAVQPVEALGLLEFTEVGVHPEANAQPTTVGKTLRDLAVKDGRLYAGYGDYGVNTGPIHINPFNLGTHTFEGSALSVPTEAISIYREVNGVLMAPMTDPKAAFTDNTGYAERLPDGNWVNREHAPLIHVFDVATLDGNDLWMVGSSQEDDGVTRRGATAYRSTDGDTTWQIAQTDANANPATRESNRYYWIAELNGKLYMQAEGVTPAAPVRSFDGTSWEEGTTDRVCGTSWPNRVEVFAGRIVCAIGSGSLRLFDGTTVEETSVPVGSTIWDLFIDGSYLYAIGTSGIARTTDLQNWQWLGVRPVGGVSVAVAGDYLYVGTQTAQILRSTQTVTDLVNAPSPPGPGVDHCFIFNPTTKTVTGYYDYQANNPAFPACPRDVVIPELVYGEEVEHIGEGAFANKSITSVVMPDTVQSIGMSAFSDNQIASVTLSQSLETIGATAFRQNQLEAVVIPNSVETIGQEVFGANRLTSVTLSSNLTAIGAMAFRGNHLTSVTIPASVTSINTYAFIDNTINGEHVYVRLYTEDPLNPAGLTDGIFPVVDIGDGSMMGGGHIINPAQITIQYRDVNGSAIAAPVSFAGSSTQSYLVAQGPVFAGGIDDLWMGWLLQAYATEVSAAYYRIGQSVEFTGPDIDGYVTPSPAAQTFALTSPVTQAIFTYGVIDSESHGDKEDSGGENDLAKTGANIRLILLGGGLSILLGTLAVRQIMGR